MYRKFKKVALGLLVHVMPSILFSRIHRIHFFQNSHLRKLFDIRFSYKHCNFLCICLLIKMVLKTVTRSIYYTILFKHHYSLTPKSMLFVVEQRLEGLKYNQESVPNTKLIWGVRGGVGIHREIEGYAYVMQKRVIQLDVCQHFCRLL